MQRVLAISGSLRTASSNTALLQAARMLAPEGMILLRRQIEANADAVLQSLYREVAAYPAPPGQELAGEFAGPERLATPLRLATRLGEMSFLNTITVFGTANDITLAELALEMLFPADDQTTAIARVMMEELA